jgi:hypothetical protein
MAHHLSEHRHRVRWGVVVSICLIGTACGGDGAGGAENEPGAVPSTANTAVSGESSEQPASGGIDLPEGFPTADALIPELVGLPVPDGAVFGVGSANDENVDPRQTAVQQIFFAIPAEEVAAFYLDELPAAGYEIVAGGLSDKSEIVAGGQAVIMFNDPDGLPGQVIIGPGSVAESQLNVNVFRSGTR